MNDEQLNIVSAVEAVSRAIEYAIYTLKLKPGQQIKEVELATRYGVSRNTIREAITGLLNSGLLIKQINKGVYVKKITLEDVREIFHLRKLFEEEAVHAIISTKVIPVSLINALECLEKINIENNWFDYVTADVAFHTALVEASNIMRLKKLYETICAEVKLCIYQSKEIILPNQENYYQHRLFIDMLESGDEVGAIKLVRDHIDYAVKKFMEGFKDLC